MRLHHLFNMLLIRCWICPTNIGLQNNDFHNAFHIVRNIPKGNELIGITQQNE